MGVLFDKPATGNVAWVEGRGMFQGVGLRDSCPYGQRRPSMRFWEELVVGIPRWDQPTSLELCEELMQRLATVCLGIEEWRAPAEPVAHPEVPGAVLRYAVLLDLLPDEQVWWQRLWGRQPIYTRARWRVFWEVREADK